MRFEEAEEFYNSLNKLKPSSDDIRLLCCNDLYFLFTRIMSRRDAIHPWLYKRCREVQLNPDGMLDLWARGHYKSSIITFALTIQDILKNPEITIGIFSHTRPIATNFVRQIKTELESNTILHELFPHVIPPSGKENRPWGESMLCVSRKTNPKEQTIEAGGIVQGQLISKHFDLRIYDDLVVPESVSNREMIQKTTDAFVLSENLGTRGGRARAIGTRYHNADTYDTLIKRGVFIPRVYPAEIDGVPQFLTADVLAEKKRIMGTYIYNSQMMQNPTPDEGSIFKKDWIRFYDIPPARYDRKIISMDCSFKGGETSDWTVVQLWGQHGGDAYLLDQIRGKWDFVQTLENFTKFVRKYPDATERIVEDKANGAAIMSALKREVPGIIPVEPYGSKESRALSCSPYFESGNVHIPNESRANWVGEFITELLTFPLSSHDDQVDTATQALQRMFQKAALRINPEILLNRRIGYA